MHIVSLYVRYLFSFLQIYLLTSVIEWSPVILCQFVFFNEKTFHQPCLHVFLLRVDILKDEDNFLDLQDNKDLFVNDEHIIHKLYFQLKSYEHNHDLPLNAYQKYMHPIKVRPSEERMPSPSADYFHCFNLKNVFISLYIS